MMKDFQLPAMPEHVLAGVSGGADSVALLYLLVRQGKRVCAVHVNHGLRGADSDEDECFVRSLCAKWQVPLRVYHAQPPARASENWAREARYAYFRQAMAETGAEALVLAHHRDDQAETLLLHLLRGAGLTGLGGMAEDTTVDGMRILRPLLAYSRQELHELLAGVGQCWREDASNSDPRYLRNALRAQALPLLERLVPGAAERLATTAKLLRADEAVLSGLTERFLRGHGGADALPLKALQAEPEGMQRRILRAWWADRAGRTLPERTLSSRQTDALLCLLNAPAASRCNLPDDWHGQRGWTHVHLIPPHPVEPMPPQRLTESPLIVVQPFDGAAGDGRRSQAIPSAWLPELTVRTRQTGDWIVPFGSSGRQSLQDYLVNRRVDAPFRDQLPLVCRGSEVLLAGGVGAGGVPRIEDMEAPVLLVWKAAFPWNDE